MVIQLAQREQYGRTRFYPANDTARAIAQIAGTKTLSASTLGIAVRQLGIPVQVVGHLEVGDTEAAEIYKLVQMS